MRPIIRPVVPFSARWEKNVSVSEMSEYVHLRGDFNAGRGHTGLKERLANRALYIDKRPRRALRLVPVSGQGGAGIYLAVSID